MSPYAELDSEVIDRVCSRNANEIRSLPPLIKNVLGGTPPPNWGSPLPTQSLWPALSKHGRVGVRGPSKKRRVRNKGKCAEDPKMESAIRVKTVNV